MYLWALVAAARKGLRPRRHRPPAARTVLVLCFAALPCVLGNGCATGPPAPTPSAGGPEEKCYEGERFVCASPRECVRIEQDGSFENDFSGHWTGDLDDSDEDSESTRRVPTVTAIIDSNGTTAVVGPCDGYLMLSYGTRDKFGSSSQVEQVIDVSEHTVHISAASRVVVDALFNFIPPLAINEGFDINIRAYRDGDLVAVLPQNGFFPLPRRISRDTAVWNADQAELPLITGVDSIEVVIRGLPLARSIDHIFVDDVRVWLELNAPDAELSLDMQADRPNALITEAVTFTATLTNTGADLAQDLRVLTNLSDHLRYDSHDGDGAFFPSEGLWVLGELGAGQEASLAIHTTVNSIAQIRVVSSAAITGGLLGDFDVGNNEAVVGIDLNSVN